MKPIVYLAAYGGKWYSAKLNKAHTILIISYVIFRVLSNMTEYLGKKWTLPDADCQGISIARDNPNCWSIHYKFFKPNVMQMFSEPSVRAAKQRKDQPGRRQQTVVKHGDVDAFVQHVDSGDDL